MLKFFLVLEILLVFTISQYDPPVVGIDFGTTFSCVGVSKNGLVTIIPNEEGTLTTPSVVSFMPNGDILVGQAAKNNLVSNPKNTIYDIKRLLGKNFAEIDRNHFAYDLVDVNGKVHVQINATGQVMTYSPEQITSFIFAKMKKIAEDYLEVKLEAVVTVPAYFNDAQMQATRDAGKGAGLYIWRVILEPMAAQIAYRGTGKSKDGNTIVFHMGGATLDVSLLIIDGSLLDIFNSTNVDMHLGGNDFDLGLAMYLAKQFQDKHGKQRDILSDKEAYQKLTRACEKAKQVLSFEEETTIEIESLIGGINYHTKVSRDLFIEINKDLFEKTSEKTLNSIKQVLNDAKLQKEEIDKVIMVGGSSRIPKIRNMIAEFFNGKKLEFEINPDEAIAQGAAIHAEAISTSDRGCGQTDIAKLSLGIEIAGGIMHNIIDRHRRIPTKKRATFTTSYDYQTQLVIPIYEGERVIAKHNSLLGEVELSGIPPARKGFPRIKVIFNYAYYEGILNVSAIDMATKNKVEIIIKRGFQMDDEMDEIFKEAATHKNEDDEFKKIYETKQMLSVDLQTRTNLASKHTVTRNQRSSSESITKEVTKIWIFIYDCLRPIIFIIGQYIYIIGLFAWFRVLDFWHF